MVAADEQPAGGGGDPEPDVLISSCFAPVPAFQSFAIPPTALGGPSNDISTKPVWLADQG